MLALWAALVIGSTPCGNFYRDAVGQVHIEGCKPLDALVGQPQPTAKPTAVPTVVPPSGACDLLLRPEHDGFDAYGAIYHVPLASGGMLVFCFDIPPTATRVRLSFGTDGAQCGAWKVKAAPPSGAPVRGDSGQQGSDAWFQPIEPGRYSGTIQNTGCDSAFRLYAW